MSTKIKAEPESVQLLQVGKWVVSVWVDNIKYHYIEWYNTTDRCLIHSEIRIVKNGKLVENKELIQLIDNYLRETNLVTTIKN